jgi:hypothetical protein
MPRFEFPPNYTLPDSLFGGGIKAEAKTCKEIPLGLADSVTAQVAPEMVLFFRVGQATAPSPVALRDRIKRR